MSDRREFLIGGGNSFAGLALATMLWRDGRAADTGATDTPAVQLLHHPPKARRGRAVIHGRRGEPSRLVGPQADAGQAPTVRIPTSASTSRPFKTDSVPG